MVSQSLRFRWSHLLLIAATTISYGAYAQFIDEEPVAHLDPPYHHARFTRLNHRGGPTDGNTPAAPLVLPSHSDTEAMIAHQTPIRNQSARGTCSIFSATAMLESMMIINGKADASIDLSEEWLEYMATFDRGGGDGSGSSRNFSLFATYGDAKESTLPYIGQDWTDAPSALTPSRCPADGNGNQDKSCLVAHFNPAFMNMDDATLAAQPAGEGGALFLSARNDAAGFKTQFMDNKLDQTVVDNYYSVSPDEVKGLLNQGIPVTVDIDFYFGAWNHREGVTYGLIRNMDYWHQGIIGYPEIGSLDRQVSQAHPDGHSVLIVGYDDDQVITENEQMTDGTTKTFTYKGVYFFKNAWGTDNFGTTSMIRGQAHPGYGTITQKYTDEFGTYFRLPLQK